MNNELPFKHQEASDSTGFLLWQVTAQWQRQIANALRPHGITQMQFVLLASLLWLSRKEDLIITQVMLAKHANTDLMTTSQVLRTLENKGYIKRKPHPQDTRAYSLNLTKLGKEIAFKAIPDVEQVDAKFFSGLKSSQEKFNRYLAVLGNSQSGTKNHRHSL